MFRCASPDGTFILISKQNASSGTVGHFSPPDWNSIDATLYVDEDGKPWTVFVHEWTSTSDGIGRMVYAPLSEDLTHMTAEPVEMFAADSPSWTNRNVTDGPYMYRCQDGTLLMVWSNYSGNGYTTGIAVSSNGRLDGTWRQVDSPLYWANKRSIYNLIPGGHGMVFTDFSGRMFLAVHAPNNEDEALMLVPLIERDGMLYQDLVQ